MKDKELIRQLWKKTKEQQDTIDELSSAVKEFLKVQPCVKKLQGNIAKIHKQVESRTFKVTVPISGPQIVKPFTPKENSEEMQPTLEHLSMSELQAQYDRLTMMPDQLPITYDSEISKTLQAMIKLRTKESREHQEQCPMLPSHEDSTIQMYEEYHDRMVLDTEYQLPEEEYFAPKAPCKHTAFMATPVKRSKGTRDYDSPEDSRDFDSTPKSEPSDTRSEDSEAKSESSNQSFNSWVKSLDIRRGLKLETSITSSQDVEPEDSQQTCAL